MRHTRLRFMLVALVLLASGLAMPGAQEAGLPADLAMVPADSLGFVHIRLADVWKSDQFKEWRETILKAGADVLAAFDKRFVPAPSSIDRMTIVLARNNAPQQEPDVVVILTTTKPFDQQAFLASMPGFEKQMVGGKAFYETRRLKLGLHFVNEQTLVMGPAESVHRALRAPPARSGEMASALRQAQQGKPLVAAVSPAALAGFLPREAFQQVPPQLFPLLQAKLAIVSLGLEKNGHVELRLEFADAQQAQGANQAVHESLKFGRAFLAKGREELRQKVLGDGQPGSFQDLPEAAASLLALGALNRLDEFLAAPPIQKDGASLALRLDFPPGSSQLLSMGAIQAALLVPAVQKVRGAASRTQGINNLKQLAIAMHNYHDLHKTLPPAAICDKNGKPLLSWRVAILPYIEQNNLYKQFKLDEPWDSEHNRQLIPMMPPTYAHPGAPNPSETHYRVFFGGGALFDLNKGVGFRNVTDGLSNTVMIVEAAECVTWTKPDELPYDAKKPLPRLGAPPAEAIFHAAMGDGSVRTLPATITEATLRAIITRDAGDIPGKDF